LAKPDTTAQFKQAGISYLLVTSVEGFSDQTIEKRRTKDFHYQTGVYYGASVYASRFGRNGSAGASASASAGVSTQGGFDPEVWQQQTIRLTVRCQLFDAATGELKKSTTGTFPFQRDYTAVAQGMNQLSTADCVQRRLAMCPLGRPCWWMIPFSPSGFLPRTTRKSPSAEVPRRA